jgi:hypothetical protein
MRFPSENEHPKPNSSGRAEYSCPDKIRLRAHLSMNNQPFAPADL